MKGEKDEFLTPEGSEKKIREENQKHGNQSKNT